jgi:hypothetical protein
MDYFSQAPLVGRNVELRAQQSEPAVALVRDRASQWYGARIRLGEMARYGLCAAQSPLGALRHHTVLYGWVGAYERHLNAEQHEGGKANTQKIESKHINLGTRMKRLRWLPPRSLYHAAAYILGRFWGNGWDGSSLALPPR